MNMSALFKRTFAASGIAISALCVVTWRAVSLTMELRRISFRIYRGSPLSPTHICMNSWGISHTNTSPFWISNQGTNTATLYAVTGDKRQESIPAQRLCRHPKNGNASRPTGQVDNANTSSFLVRNGGDGASAHFIFANLNGTISAWDSGTTAFIQVTTPGAVYTGLAINNTGTLLYAANNAAGSYRCLQQLLRTGEPRPSAFATPAAISAESRPVQRGGHQRRIL